MVSWSAVNGEFHWGNSIHYRKPWCI